MPSKKRKVVANDTNENADWIKALPGHREEARLHDNIAASIKMGTFRPTEPAKPKDEQK